MLVIAVSYLVQRIVEDPITKIKVTDKELDLDTYFDQRAAKNLLEIGMLSKVNILSINVLKK